MGGRSSKQIRAEHADYSTSHPTQIFFDENHSSHGNNDRVFTDCTHSAKLLDNQREDENHRLYLNSDITPQTFFSPTRTISSPTRTVHTFENSNLEKQEKMHAFENSNLEQEKEMHTFEKSELQQQKEMLPFENSKVEQRKEMHVFENSKLEQQKENNQVSEPNSSIVDGKGPEEKYHKKDDYHEESDDDSYGGRISDYDGLIGSPSFREYCIKDCLKTDDNSCDREIEETKAKADKYNTSSNAEEDSTTSSKKRRKRKSIKQVISMGKPSAMRNLLNVSACYNPAIFASRDKLIKPVGENV